MHKKAIYIMTDLGLSWKSKGRTSGNLLINSALKFRQGSHTTSSSLDINFTISV
jgi:hypothetical protein